MLDTGPIKVYLGEIWRIALADSAGGCARADRSAFVRYGGPARRGVLRGSTEARSTAQCELGGKAVGLGADKSMDCGLHGRGVTSTVTLRQARPRARASSLNAPRAAFCHSVIHLTASLSCPFLLRVASPTLRPAFPALTYI